jgi:hypothetical protein
VKNAVYLDDLNVKIKRDCERKIKWFVNLIKLKKKKFQEKLHLKDT